MKQSVNLINTLDHRQHKEIVRWYRNSCALLMVILCSAFIVEYRQWQAYKKIASEKASMQTKTIQFNTLMERKQKLKKEETELQSKLTTLEHYNTKKNNSVEFVSKLNKIAHFQLASISLNKHSVTMSGYCTTTHQATQIIHTISQLPSIKNIKLSSLSPKIVANKPLLQLTLRGSLKEI